MFNRIVHVGASFVVIYIGFVTTTAEDYECQEASYTSEHGTLLQLSSGVVEGADDGDDPGHAQEDPDANGERSDGELVLDKTAVENTFAFLFYAVDMNQDSLISRAECEVFMSNPSCTNCLRQLASSQDLTPAHLCAHIFLKRAERPLDQEAFILLMLETEGAHPPHAGSAGAFEPDVSLLLSKLLKRRSHVEAGAHSSTTRLDNTVHTKRDC